MTLFDYIFQWYSVHIFSTDGFASEVLDDVIVLQDTNTSLSMSLSVWLNGTATIITMVLLVVVLMLFVRWIFKLVSGLFLLR